MIKNVIGAWAGAKLAKSSPKVSTPGGAAGGALAASVLPFVISRLSIPAMLLVGAGAYVWQKQTGTNQPAKSARTAATPARKSPRKAAKRTAKQPVAAKA